MFSVTDKSPKNRIKQSRTPRSSTTPRRTTKDTKVSISQTPEEQGQFPSITVLLKHFTSIFLHLKRAVVRCGWFLIKLFITKHCVTILTIFYMKRPHTSETSKKFHLLKAMFSCLLKNVQVQCMKCQT